MAQTYEVFNLATDESHGIFDTMTEARGCVSFDKLTRYEITKDTGERMAFRDDADDFDPENIYATPSIAQSIAEDKARR